MGWFKKITKGISKAVSNVGNFADDALGFDPNGGGFTDIYNVAGMATTGLPIGSMGSAGVNLSQGDVKGALKQGLNGAMVYGAGSLGGMLGGSGGGLGNILGGGQQGQMDGNVIAPQQARIDNGEDSPIKAMAVLNNQSPLTSKPRKDLTKMLLNNLMVKHGGMNG